MVQQLLNHIEKHQLCKTTDKILLAVSGGIDSMTMLNLFMHAGLKVGVAHCNYQLRGEDSDEDERFVRRTCEKLNVPFYSERFSTEAIALQKGESIQSVARELRYKFFSDVALANAYDIIATGHTLNDNIETILLNFARGTGIEGLTGIPFKNANVIRPLICMSRKDILAWAVREKIEWREDASNESDDYRRNVIRHHVIPQLLEINPSFESTSASTIERLRDTASVFFEKIQSIGKALLHEEQGRLRVRMVPLKEMSEGPTVLWELIKGFGFNYFQCKLVLQQHQTGKRFVAKNHELIIDRDDAIISPIKEFDEVNVIITAPVGPVQADGRIFDFRVENKQQIERHPLVAQLDADKLQFPLVVRRWAPGDRMMPLGMRDSKKVSDILIDAKVSSADKRQVLVLISGPDVVWLVGHRIHEGYKITEQTKKVLRIDVREC